MSTPTDLQLDNIADNPKATEALKLLLEAGIIDASGVEDAMKQSKQQKILEQFDIIKFNKIKNFKPIEFNTPRYLFYKISNKQNFIIINEELSKIIDNIDNEKPPFIEYYIENNNFVSIKFENGENIKLRSNENIINDYSLNYSGKVEE